MPLFSSTSSFTIGVNICSMLYTLFTELSYASAPDEVVLFPETRRAYKDAHPNDVICEDIYSF